MCSFYKKKFGFIKQFHRTKCFEIVFIKPVKIKNKVLIYEFKISLYFKFKMVDSQNCGVMVVFIIYEVSVYIFLWSVV